MEVGCSEVAISVASRPNVYRLMCRSLLAAGENPSLGCPVEYINLKGSSKEHPVVCKYTGNKYYSDDWRGSH